MIRVWHCTHTSRSNLAHFFFFFFFSHNRRGYCCAEIACGSLNGWPQSCCMNFINPRSTSFFNLPLGSFILRFPGNAMRSHPAFIQGSVWWGGIGKFYMPNWEQLLYSGAGHLTWTALTRVLCTNWEKETSLVALTNAWISLLASSEGLLSHQAPHGVWNQQAD